MNKLLLCLLLSFIVQLQVYSQSLIVPEWKALIDNAYDEAPSDDYIVVLLHLGVILSVDTQLEEVLAILDSESFKTSATENKVIVKLVEYDNHITKNIFLNDRTYLVRYPSWIAYDRYYQALGIESGYSKNVSGNDKVFKFIRNQVQINQYLTDHMKKASQQLDSLELTRIVEDYSRKMLPVPEVFVRQILERIPANAKLNDDQLKYLIKLAPAVENYKFNVVFNENNSANYLRIFNEEMTLEERKNFNVYRIRKSTQKALDNNDIILAKNTADFLKSTYGQDENAANYRYKYLMDFGVLTNNIEVLMGSLLPYSQSVYFQKDMDTLKANYIQNLQNYEERNLSSPVKIPASMRTSVFGPGVYAFYWAEHIYELSKSDQDGFLRFASRLVDFSLNISEEGFNLNLKSKILSKMGNLSEAKKFAQLAVIRAKETEDPHVDRFEKWLQSL